MEKFEQLTPPELILLQKHIELGKDHLIEVLGKNDFEEYLQLAKPKERAIQEMQSDETETAGNLVLAINTIITASFGGWMGFSSVVGLKLGSPILFGSIFSLATIVGAAIGYHNYRFIKQESQQMVETLQLLELETKILHMIRRKREKELREIEDFLFTTLSTLSKEKVSDWKLAIQHLFDDTSDPVHSRIQENIGRLSQEKIAHPKAAQRDLPSPIEKLIYSYPRKTKTPKSWFHQNKRKILISLIPTLFGGFSSMFVYLSGSTEIAKAFEYHDLVHFLTSPQVRSIKIALSILMTLYFGFSFLYSSRKSHKRFVEIERKREEIAKEESSLTLLDEQLFTLRQIREDVKLISNLLQNSDRQKV